MRLTECLMTAQDSSPFLNPPHHNPTMSHKTYLACIGTRPEIIKMAPIYRELKARGDHVVVLHTGQHEAVADALYAFFDMPPDTVIDLQRKSPSLAHLTSALLDGVEVVLKEFQPDVVMVQGDTTSALVGAMTAFYQNIPVAHVEAGLRTHEREPFPEEKNRELIGQLAQWHFPPTAQASSNLLSEGIDASDIYQVGNTVIDAALWTRDRITQPSFDMAAMKPQHLQDFEARYADHKLILVTAHRRENWGQPIRNIARAVANVLSEHPDTVAVWPVHPNPAVQADVAAELQSLPPRLKSRICLTEPLGYQALISLLIRCEFTLTDSGGILEEASAFSKPVLVARKSTERQELVDAGGAHLVGTDMVDIFIHAEQLLTNPIAYRRMQLDTSPFGDGHSAARIVDVLSDSATTPARVLSFPPVLPVYQNAMHSSATTASA